MRRSLGARVRDRVAGLRRHVDLCMASGWQLTRGCTDGHGHAICPACTQPVRLRPHRPVGETAWIVEDH
jgi:hypothetical protein